MGMDRRSFLKGLGVGLLAGALGAIVRKHLSFYPIFWRTVEAEAEGVGRLAGIWWSPSIYYDRGRDMIGLELTVNFLLDGGRPFYIKRIEAYTPNKEMFYLRSFNVWEAEQYMYVSYEVEPFTEPPEVTGLRYGARFMDLRIPVPAHLIMAGEYRVRFVLEAIRTRAESHVEVKARLIKGSYSREVEEYLTELLREAIRVKGHPTPTILSNAEFIGEYLTVYGFPEGDVRRDFLVRTILIERPKNEKFKRAWAPWRFRDIYHLAVELIGDKPEILYVDGPPAPIEVLAYLTLLHNYFLEGRLEEAKAKTAIELREEIQALIKDL